MLEVKPLSHARFEALLYRRAPWTFLMSRELEWWTTDDESLLAVVSLDLIDDDFSLAILGRDEQGLFRAINVMCSLETIEVARREMKKRFTELSFENLQEFPQGDNDKKKHEILVPCVPASKLNHVFEYLLKNGSSAKFVGEFRLREFSKRMKQRDLQQFKTAIAVGFSHA